MTVAQISIHAPREGSDLNSENFSLKHDHISIHAPREGSDASNGGRRSQPGLFQSTLPVRGATWKNQKCRFTLGYFNPRSP